MEHGFDKFTTSLTVSPHKRSETVFEAGREVGGEAFAEENFKKRDGFKRSLELSAQYGLYRQNYCGCEFSSRPPADGRLNSQPPQQTMPVDTDKPL